MPKVCQLFNLECQCAKVVPSCHFSNLACKQSANFSFWWPNFQTFFLRNTKGKFYTLLLHKKSSTLYFMSYGNAIMLDICKFQEYLGNSRKLISRNKEFKFRHLQTFIKEKSPKIFDVVFNGACEINRTIIQLVWNGTEYIFYLPNFIRCV